MTRAEHLAWARQRALEHLARSGPMAAINSMIKDLGQYPEIEASCAPELQMPQMPHMPDALVFAEDVRRWIEAFK